MVFALLAFLPLAVGTTITGTIYCDNQFEFYFNGALIATDPLSFTPHNAVSVSFEYTEGDDKTYAIMCQDYASDSGYEYTETTSPQLGDGALIAEFSDGTVTSTSWKYKVVTHGPTDDSETAGCSSSNLDACEVEDYGTPSDWELASYDDSAWTASTTYTASEAGWGRTPSWSGGECCQPTSPMTRADLTCCNCNYDATDGSVAATVTESECLDPEVVLGSSSADFIWTDDLEKDNKVLFRYTEAYTPSPTPTPSPSPTPTPSPSPTPSPTGDANMAAPRGRALLLPTAAGILGVACMAW